VVGGVTFAFGALSGYRETWRIAVPPWGPVPLLDGWRRPLAFSLPESVCVLRAPLQSVGTLCRVFFLIMEEGRLSGVCSYIKAEKGELRGSRRSVSLWLEMKSSR